jgi:hypothetical protein
MDSPTARQSSAEMQAKYEAMFKDVQTRFRLSNRAMAAVTGTSLMRAAIPALREVCSKTRHPLGAVIPEVVGKVKETFVTLASVIMTEESKGQDVNEAQNRFGEAVIAFENGLRSLADEHASHISIAAELPEDHLLQRMFKGHTAES